MVLSDSFSFIFQAVLKTIRNADFIGFRTHIIGLRIRTLTIHGFFGLDIFIHKSGMINFIYC